MDPVFLIGATVLLVAGLAVVRTGTGLSWSAFFVDLFREIMRPTRPTREDRR